MKLFTKFIFLSLFVFLFINKTSANVYSAQLHFTNPDGTPFDGSFSDGTGGMFTFFLNDTASSVTITVKDVSDNSVAATIDAGAMSSGKNIVSWDGTVTVSGKRYYYEIKAEQPARSNSDWSIFFDSGDINIYSRGGDMVTNMKSDLFGLIVAPNNGGPLGTGITIYNPDGSFHDPFIIAQDTSEGGTVVWGSQTENIVGGFFDDLGRFYVSAFSQGELRRLDQGGTLTTVAGGLTSPKGIFVQGTGSDRKIYVCSGNQILRMDIGDDNVFSGFSEVVADFTTGYPKDVALDEEGNLYTCLRTDVEDLNADGAGHLNFHYQGHYLLLSLMHCGQLVPLNHIKFLNYNLIMVKIGILIQTIYYTTVLAQTLEIMMTVSGRWMILIQHLQLLHLQLLQNFNYMEVMIT